MRISAKVDYAVRACVELAIRSPRRADGATKGDVLGGAQHIPTKYLENILSELRRSGIVGSQRGADGGYWLARPASQISGRDGCRARRCGWWRGSWLRSPTLYLLSCSLPSGLQWAEGHRIHLAGDGQADLQHFFPSPACLPAC